MSEIKAHGRTNVISSRAVLKPRGSEMPQPPVLTPLLIPLRVLFAYVIGALIDRHPTLFERMGPHAGSRFLIAPRELPFMLYLVTDPCEPVLEPALDGAAPACDARIGGGLFQLIALVSAEADGDALFFSRDLEFNGDTEAVLALRNAIDAAGFVLTEEMETILGPAGMPLRFARHGAGRLHALAERLRSLLLAPALSRIGRIEQELAQLRHHEVDRARRRYEGRAQRRARGAAAGELDAVGASLMVMEHEDGGDGRGSEQSE